MVLACGEVHEKGHGSAMDIVRRNWVRQISESGEGMFDMVFKTNNTSYVLFQNHGILTATFFFFIGCVY